MTIDNSTDNSTPDFKIFDGHNDTLLRLEMARQAGKPCDFFQSQPGCHIDAVKARDGGFAGGFFAMFTPSLERKQRRVFKINAPQSGDPISHDRAMSFTRSMMEIAEDIVAKSGGKVAICTSADHIRHAMDNAIMAMVLHIEGAEAVDDDFNSLATLYQQGLRSIGPVWSRHNSFAFGVPFSFPGSPDQGDGLTDLGHELVGHCNDMGIVLDTSHLNEKGFWDIAQLSDNPLVATHSNVHALCPSPRNLTDKQLDAIAESKGVVGLNFACGFLRNDGAHNNNDVPMSTLVAHLDYLLEKLGEDGVALGSDFDGCNVPKEISNAAGLPVLINAMKQSGYDTALIDKITSRNWISLLERTLKV